MASFFGREGSNLLMDTADSTAAFLTGNRPDNNGATGSDAFGNNFYCTQVQMQAQQERNAAVSQWDSEIDWLQKQLGNLSGAHKSGKTYIKDTMKSS